MYRNSFCTGAAGIEAAEESADLMRANIARKQASDGVEAPTEEKKLATWGTDVPDDLVLDEKKLAESLKKEDERRKEEKDERKRKYNVKWNDEVCLFTSVAVLSIHFLLFRNVILTNLLHSLLVTAEDMEAYRMKKVHYDDPMRDFLH